LKTPFCRGVRCNAFIRIPDLLPPSAGAEWGFCYLINILLYQRQKKRFDRTPSGVTDVSDLYILNFSCLKYRIFTSASISFPKWEEKVGKGFDFRKQDINISSTFLNVVLWAKAHESGGVLHSIPPEGRGNKLQQLQHPKLMLQSTRS
jgi:hypothetical protein